MKWVGLAAFLAVACATTTEPEVASIAGRYLGHPPEGQVINLHTQKGTVHHTSTDQEGRFSFEGLEPGSYVVAVETAGCPDATERYTLTLERGQTANVTLGIMGPDTVAVRGVVRMGQFALPNVQIGFCLVASGAVPYLTTTGPTGDYEILLEAPGEYIVSYSNPKGRSREWPVCVPRERGFDLDIEISGARLSGQVVREDGSGKRGVDILLRSEGQGSHGYEVGELQESGRKGLFVFEDLPGGTFKITVDEPYFAWPPTITLIEGEQRDDFEIRLVKAAAVTGRVTNAGGRAVAGATVFMASAPGNTAYIVRSDPNGSYWIEDFAPGDWVLLAAERSPNESEEAIEPLLRIIRSGVKSEFVKGPLRISPGEATRVDLVAMTQE